MLNEYVEEHKFPKPLCHSLEFLPNDSGYGKEAQAVFIETPVKVLRG